MLSVSVGLSIFPLLSVSVCLPACIYAVCLPAVFMLSVCLTAYIPVAPCLCLPACLYAVSVSVCLSGYIPVAPWLCLPVCLYAVSVCLSDCLYSRCSLSLSACLSICCLCLSVCVSVCIPVAPWLCLPVCLLSVYILVSPCLSLSVSPGPTLIEHAVITSGLLGATEANGTSTCSDHHGQVRVRQRHDVIAYDHVVFGTGLFLYFLLSIFFVDALLASELCGCVKVEADVLGSPFLIVRTVSVDVKQYGTNAFCSVMSVIISKAKRSHTLLFGPNENKNKKELQNGMFCNDANRDNAL